MRKFEKTVRDNKIKFKFIYITFQDLLNNLPSRWNFK